MEPREPLAPFLLAFPGPLRDRLVAAVLSGEKVSTTGLVCEYELEQEELPPVGERSALIDSDGREVAVVEVTEVRVLPLGAVDLQHALDEGEGYASVAEWRAGRRAVLAQRGDAGGVGGSVVHGGRRDDDCGGAVSGGRAVGVNAR
ncbi:ASCH domain-containing protein, partial [Streptomyces sp. Ncost-T6T-2b]